MNPLSMNTGLKHTILLLFAGLTCLLYGKGAIAQTQNTVNITVNIIPPYSPYYSDYSGANASKVLLILQNLGSAPKTIKLAGQLEGNNGIRITTKSNYVPLQPIVLNPNETKQLNGLALKDIFDINTLNVYGVDKTKIVQTSRLPEGNYNFCIQALDYNTGQLLSASAPMGCTNVNITYPEAPILTSPMNSETVSALPGAPQYVPFSWMSTATGNFQYEIQMAPMPDRVFKDPNQLLNETSFPMLSKTVNGFSYSYTINDLALEIGKRYAWRVKITDPTGKVVFKNGGMSAASIFTYGKAAELAAILPISAKVQEIPILLPNPANADKTVEVNNKYPLYLRWKLINTDDDVTSTAPSVTNRTSNYSKVSAIKAPYMPYKYVIEILDRQNKKLVDKREGIDEFYYMENPGTPSLFVSGKTYDFNIKSYSVKAGGPPAAKDMLSNYTVPTGESKTGTFIYKKIADTLATQKYITLLGTVKYKFEKNAELYPTSGKFLLSKYYKQVDGTGNTIKDNIPVPYYEPDKFNVSIYKDGLFEAKVPLFAAPSGHVACYKISYPANNYYESPKKVIELTAKTGETANVGEFVSTVYSYKLNLHLTKGYRQKGSTKVSVNEGIEGLRALIYRLKKPSTMPVYEGQNIVLNGGLAPDKTLPYGAVLVASQLTKLAIVPGKPTEAVVTVDRLLCAIDAEDTYYIKVYDPKTNASIINQAFRFSQQDLNSPAKYYTSAKKVSNYTYEIEKNLTWTVDQAPLANVKGRLLYRYSDGVGGARPLAGAGISLQAFIVLQETKSTRTYALPLSFVNRGDFSLFAVNEDGSTKEKPSTQDNKIFGHLNGMSGTVGHTVTNSDGSFSFKDLPIWDSVYVAASKFNFFIPYPEIPKPDQVEPGNGLYRQMGLADMMGDKGKGEALFKEFKERVKNSATDPIRNPLDPSRIISVMTVREKVDVTVPEVVKNVGGLNSSVEVAYDVKAASKIKTLAPGVKVIQSIKGGIKAFDDEPLLENFYFREGVSATGPCNVKVVYRVVVDNEDVFCSPDNNVEINPLQTIESLELYSTVRTMQLRAKVYRADEFDKNKTNNKQVESIPVEVHKNYDPIGSLAGVGETFHYKGAKSGQLLDQAVTVSDGVIFKHILRNKEYKLRAVVDPKTNNMSSYIGSEKYFNFSSPERDMITQLGKTFLFNSDFTEEIMDVDLQLQPDEPVFAGRVLNSQGTKALPMASVKIRTVVGSINYEKTLLVDKDGYFATKDPVLAKGPTYVSVYVDGYKPKNYSDSTANGRYDYKVAAIQKGYKLFKNHYFLPAASLKGYVVNQAKENIPALYKIQAIDFIQETACRPPLFNNSGDVISSCKQYFEALTPLNTGARLIIIPNDLKYFNDTLAINVMTNVENTKLYERVLTTREHRIDFIVRGRKGGSLVPLKGATIKILDQTLVTDAYGRVQHSFMNISENNFTVKVTPSAADNYVEKEHTFSNKESKNFVREYIDLDAGVKIEGIVDINGERQAGAVVFVDNGSGGTSISTVTRQDGSYELKGIKPDPTSSQVEFAIVASGPSNYNRPGTVVAQRKMVSLSYENRVDFSLNYIGDADLSSLLGYKVIVESAERAQNRYYISGSISLVDPSGDFKLLDEKMRVGFSNVEVVPADRNSQGIITYAPTADIQLDLPEFKARFKGAYNAQIFGNAGGIILKKLDNKTGMLVVGGRIVDNSFDFPSSYLEFKGSEFYFALKSGQSGKLVREIDAFQTGKKENKTYYFTNKKTEAINFSLLQFPASTEPLETYFNNGQIRLLPVIKPSGVKTLGKEPLTIKLPQILISKNSVSKINGAAPIEFGLDDAWKISVSKWEFSTEEGGIVSLPGSSNLIKTGALDVPFEKFRLRNDVLLVDKAQLNKIKLGNVVDLKVNAESESTFGIDNKIGIIPGEHYILRMLGKGNAEAGSISGLTGFKDPIGINAITLVSNGEQYVDFAPNSKTVKAFDLIDFQPLMIQSSPGAFTLMGNVDLKIPRLQAFYGGFRYTSLSNVVPEFKAIKFDIGKGYVSFKSDVSVGNADQNKKLVAPGKIELYGQVYEPNQLNDVNVVLTHTATSATTTSTTITQSGETKFPYGSDIDMHVSNAKTAVVNKDWDYLTFTGNMRKKGSYSPIEGFKKDNPMNFKVYGEISSDGDQLEVSGMETPFGSMRLVFDYANAQLIGNLKVDNLDFGGVSMTGEAEVSMGKKGFYMMAAGEVNFGVAPFSPVRAGVLIGRYKGITPDVLLRTLQFNRNKALPGCKYKGGEYDFTGLLVSGRKDLFKPIDYQLDLPPLLPLLSVGLAAEVGVDGSMFLNFAQKPSITLAVGAFGSVSVSAASITGTSASGSVNVDVTAQLDYTYSKPSQFRANLFAGLQLGYSVVQKLPLLPDINKSGYLGLSAKADLNSANSPMIKFDLSLDTAPDVKGCVPATKY